jgi:hypothetical protein
MFSNEQWLANSGGDFYNGVATQSLRFDDGSSAYLTRTPSSAGNRKTWTWSGWVKRGALGSSYYMPFGADSGGGTGGALYFYNDFLHFGQGATSYRITNAVFRDVSSWYHVLLTLDTTDATAVDRVKIYINGNQVTSFSTTNNPSVNADLAFNNNVAHAVGADIPNTGARNYFDGYMSDVNFIDGLALTPTSFGEFKNGAWIPVDTSGLTFGTNGFRLKFDQVGVGTASSSTIGADTSGNTNHWTSSGIVASDCAMPDSPENNFATLNPLAVGSGETFSEGNTDLLLAGSGSGGVGTISMTTGKWYYEIDYNYLSNTPFSDYTSLGICLLSSELPPTTNIFSASGVIAYYANNGKSYINGVGATYGASFIPGDIIGVAVDMEASTVTFYKNNISQGSLTTAGVGSSLSPYFVNAGSVQSVGMAANFGNPSYTISSGNADANGYGNFEYAPPTGYLALCTSNLPEPTIGANSLTQADDHFNTVLYTGNNSTNNITGVGFQPDWVWVKKRSTAGDHKLIDSTRGVGQVLESNTTDSEADESSSFTAFGADGFSLAGTAGAWNENSATYVAWNWLANGGTTVTNESGSIDSTVQANTDAGFSIVTYTGTGTAGTIAHGLGAIPNMYMVKCLDNSASTDHWYVYHAGIASNAEDYEIYLNLTARAYENNNYPWNETKPTNSVFSIKTLQDVNQSSKSYVAYCFADVEGYSKFGSYFGNGNADGTFVYTGFRPAWVIVKAATGAVQHWHMFDNKRNGYNVDNDPLYANLNIAEYNTDVLDFVSNGFKMRTSSAVTNASGVTYIYMAFGDSTKYANAR